jgi:hypothetical protein
MTIGDLNWMEAGFQRRLYCGLLEQNLGPALVIEDEEGIVCFCGAVIIWPGVAEIWFKMIRQTELLSLMRVLKRLLKKGAQHFKIRRIQANVEDGFDKGCRFAEFFQFTREALLKRHNYKGTDDIMYARLF